MTSERFQTWIHAFRLRTLPLAMGSIILASFLAASQGSFKIEILIFTLSTALSLQILANLANDYGDAVKGTDNQNRVGPMRAIQSGIISREQILNAIIIIIILAIISGLCLLYFGFGNVFSPSALTFAGIGVCAIIAALHYTIGKTPYGYAGFGDLFVFIFFGLVGTMGTFYLHTKEFQLWTIPAATAIGLLSVGVLNINNMRDTVNDKQFGKQTIAVRLGYSVAKKYQCWLVTIACLVSLFLLFINTPQPISVRNFTFLLVYPFLIKITFQIYQEPDPARLDPYLMRMSMLTLIFAILIGVSVYA
ncbi:1,4-dihydroxy-2-naphthoate octaprenyltransferase [Candidatus Neomarinimicrobiota bacterium]